MTPTKGGGRAAQLKLLMWKNLLQQIRSPVFTVLELVVPLLLIGISFGLMIALRPNYEHSYPATVYNPWMVQGSAVDLIIPPDFMQIFVDTIVNTQYILTGENDDCIFLNVTRHQKGKNITANIALEIVYTPTNPEIDNIMKTVQQRYTSSNILEELIADIMFTMPGALKYMPAIDRDITISISSTAKITPKKSESELVKYITSSLSTSQCSNPILGGVVFGDSFAKSVTASDSIIYTIRLSNTKRRYRPALSARLPWNTRIKFAVPSRIGPFDPLNPSGGNPGYWQEGFLSLQKAIDVAVQKHLSNSTNGPMLMLQRFPYPPYKNLIIELGSFFLPTIVAYSFMINVVYITRSIVVEKETRLKSYMKVMGLSQWLLWLSYLISNYIKLMITVVVLSSLYYVVTPKSDPTVAFVFFALYAFNVIYIAFAISVFLDSGAAAMQIVPFVWVVLYAWQLLFNVKDLISPFSPSVRLLNSLNPDIALTYGIGFMCQYETLASGIHWSQLFVHPTPDEPLTLGHFFLMLIVDAVILGVVTWYVEALNPGFDGVPQKPYFFLQRSYWFGKRTCARKGDDFSRTDLKDLTNGSLMNAFVETAPDTLQATVKIVNLCKTYRKPFLQKLLYCNFSKKETKAVKHLYTEMYYGQITALLGQNGAGKSTTFSILTGVLQPTDGTAYIEGRDIRSELPEIQTRLGLCPQYNIVFDCLTVLEHLRFFCKLKGRFWQRIEADDLLHRLNMEDKRNVYGQYLSGGQKRKLSLAIALIGGSELVLLDEPTSGMDPDARHESWSLLQNEKRRRTILLSTHYMDEADILGDRISIMAHGRLECSGSGLFLKKQFGAGYRLIVLFRKKQQLEEHERKVSQTLTLLRQYCSSAVLQSSNGFEVTFMLSAQQRHNFPRLFRELELAVGSLGISTFGVSVTTMDEVFLKVCQRAAEKMIADGGEFDKEKYAFSVADLRYEDRLQGCQYYLQHFRAMFYKRLAYFFRKRTFFLLELIFPAVCMALIIEAFMMLPVPKVQPSLPINLKTYTSRGEIANIYVDNTTAVFFRKSLQRVVQEAASENTQHKYPFRETVTDNVTEAILEGLEKQKDRGFGLHNPVAYNYFSNLFIQDWFIGLFNNYALHSPPLAVNLADIAIMSKAVQRNISIEVSNHPLPPATTDRLKNEDVLNQPALILGFAAIMSLSAVVASFVNFVIYEKTTKSKHMQMLCGLRHWMYWLTAFLWDYFVFLIPASLCMVVFVAVGLKVYIARSTVALTLYLIMLLYAWAELPFVYFCSAIFNSPTKGNATICVYNFMTGMIGAVAVSIVERASGADTALTLSIVWAFFFPTYNLSSCFSKAYTNEYARDACASVDCTREEIRAIAKQCCDPNDRIYVDNMLASGGKMGMKLMVIFFFLHSIIFWLAIAAYEANLSGILKRRFQRVIKNDKVASMQDGQPSSEDSDVKLEGDAVQKMGNNDALMIVRDLQKWFGKLHAVKKINFHVQKGECFGLLGVNGAGKTTTFQMLTGEVRIGAGEAFVHGWSVDTQWRKACGHIGYCPQFDAHIGEMTGEEALSMFARLRGVRERDVAAAVKSIIRAVSIGSCAANLIKTYSGGNKRRLSLGIALLTLPEVLMLDEPTTGVDPKASRIIWNILSKVRQAGTALVLTSHSMEECEALCTQIAIMVSGEFRCLGSTQHIKSKYGNGYSLTIRLRQPNQIKRTKELVAEMFHDSLLKDEHILHLNYELVAEKGQTWSMLFEKVEKLVNLVDAADYSISQTTLDQIFLDFSRNARFNGTDAGRIIISRPCQGAKENFKNIHEGSELSSVSGTTSTGATSTAVSNTGTTSSA